MISLALYLNIYISIVHFMYTTYIHRCNQTTHRYTNSIATMLPMNQYNNKYPMYTYKHRSTPYHHTKGVTANKQSNLYTTTYTQRT